MERSGQPDRNGKLNRTALRYWPRAVLSSRPSQELFRKCVEVYRALDKPMPAEAENALRLELENGSHIVSLPGKEHTIRAFSGYTLKPVPQAD